MNYHRNSKRTNSTVAFNHILTLKLRLVGEKEQIYQCTSFYFVNNFTNLYFEMTSHNNITSSLYEVK